MNNGKICISVSAETAKELIEQLRRAEKLADIVELRFDQMYPYECKAAFADLKSEKPILFTYRPESQGGGAPDDPAQRLFFWMTLYSECEMAQEMMWFDNEGELKNSLQWPDGVIAVRSFHDIAGVPENLSAVYEELSSYDQIVKIAVTASDITDAIPVWKLLERANAEGKRLIPIAMGDAGKWTRILGPAHGAFMTYASLEAGAETAPGQISAADMIDVFRVKELNKDTEIYGIIAGDTSYSISPWMHNAAFKAADLNKVFMPLQVTDLDDFMQRMVDPETREVELNFKGFSVTNPHKKSIIKHLDKIDAYASKIGAVNTVKIDDDNKLVGFNTDGPGFVIPLKKVLGDVKKANVGIVGTGGAARACIYALKEEGANVTIFARSQRKADRLAEEFGVKSGKNNSFRPGTVDILVNATPLGTKGDYQDWTIATSDQLNGIRLVYDLVYNPLETRLVREARKAGVPALGGFDMLVAQGRKQFEIWTGETAPVADMAAAVKRRLNL